MRECHNITGTVEHLPRVEVSDLAACEAFHTDVLGTLPQVGAITTCVVMDSPKDERGRGVFTARGAPGRRRHGCSSA